MLQKKILVACCFVLLSGTFYAQVNLQTGSAVFSLPMFSWQDHKSRLNSSVAVSYNSGNGLKVNDVASNLGQGWSMIAGGVITRMQVGEPDDQYARDNGSEFDLTRYPHGILYAQNAPELGCPEALTRYPIYKAMNQKYTLHNAVVEDKQLDYFSFQFNGKAGLFVLNPDDLGKVYMLGDSKLKINFQLDPGLVAQGIRTRITSFTIQDIDGLIYKFTRHGLTKVLATNYCDQTLTHQLSQPEFKDQGVYHMKGFDNGQLVNPFVVGSWYLTEVEDPLTHRKILFSYVNRNIDASAGVDFSYNQEKNYSLISHKKSVSVSPELSSITYPDGHTVTFNFGAQRVDLPGSYAMSGLTVTYQSRNISQYLFNTSYFIGNRYGTPSSEFQNRMARLCLRSIKKIGVDLKEDTPPYIFDYYMGSNAPDDFVPGPFSFAHDIWGYFNGNNSVSYSNAPVPLGEKPADLTNDRIRGLCFLRTGITGINLNTKSGYAKNGLLREIIYPTGGTLSYEYVQNTGLLNGTHQNVGGVHVVRTSSTDGGFSNNCANPMVTQYNYVDAGGSQSSLWGLEMPQNKIVTETHYEPESKYFKWLSLKCAYRFQYPGILSQQQAISLTDFQKFMIAAEPVLGVISLISTITNIATLIGATAPGFGTIAAVVIDVIAALVTIFLTCFGDKSRDYTSTVYYNSDLNGIAPLPTQYKRVEVVENPGTIGKTIHEFTSGDDYPIWEPTNPNLSAKQRYAPWAYGLPKKITVLNSTGQKVSETENVYSFSTTYPIEPHCGIGAESPLEQRMHFDRTLLLKRALNVFCAKCQVKKSSSQRNTDWGNPAIYNDPASYRTASTASLGVDIYQLFTGRCELDFTHERTYKTGSPSEFLQSTTQYIYNDQNYEIASVVTTKSDGTKARKNFYYAIDYVKPHGLCYYPRYENATTNAEMNTLVNNNIISQVIETSTQENYYFVLDEATVYTTLANGDIKPLKSLTSRFKKPEAEFGPELERTIPQVWFTDYYNGANRVPAALFNPANPDYTFYKVQQTYTYDASGNLIGVANEGNRKITSIFGYDDKYVVATVVNADAVTDKSFYSSFEVSGLGTTGGWVINNIQSYNSPGAAVTGTRTFALLSNAGNSVSASGLNTSKPYVLSFWSNNANVVVTGGATLSKSGPTIAGFTYYEYNIAQGTASVSLRTNTPAVNSNIDELRLYPASARMNTVAYDPAIGKLTECDANNRIVKYEYDNLGRLQFTKDQAGNIVRMFEYNNISEGKQNGCPGTYSNRLISEQFVRNNCGATALGGTVTYTVPAAMFTSTISQADADAKAEAYLLTNGQTYANANGACIPLYFNTVQSQGFVTETCNPGFVGGTVTYTVPANRYSSTISVPDANLKALAEIAANGQAYANAPGTAVCIASNAPLWEWKEGDPSYCLSVNGNLPPHLFVLETDINPNSPTYNQTRWSDIGPSDDCPAGNYYNSQQSGSFYKNNCGSGTSLVPVTYVVPPGRYSSTVSQAAANQLAINDVNANGQAYANAMGSCCSPSFTYAPGISNIVLNYTSLSGTTINFTWVFGYPGSTTIQLGTISACAVPSSLRTIPKYIGTSLYHILVYPNGNVVLQWISGPVASGTVGVSGNFDLYQNAYYSAQQSGSFTRNNCPSGQVGSTVTYTVQPFVHTSFISQADADQKAVNDVNTNGQNYANTNGTCTTPPASCNFLPTYSMYSNQMTKSGSTVSFNLVFSCPSANWYGGSIGYINGATCRPSVTRYLYINDGGGGGRVWQVTVSSSGPVSISLSSGAAPSAGAMIVLAGSFSL